MQMFTRTHSIVALIALGFACVAVSAVAQMYIWTDAQGRKHYSDSPPPPSTKGVQKKALETGGGTGPTEPFALRAAREKHPVKLYTGSDCGAPCVQARDYLNKRGVPFAEINVNNNDLLEELRKVSGSNTVPVMLVGAETYKGYALSIYERALDDAGYPAMGVLPARSGSATATGESSSGRGNEELSPSAPGPYAPRPSRQP